MSVIDVMKRANTTRNVARWDRLVRAALPLVVAGLWAGDLIPAIVAIPLGVLSLMLFPTAITGACSVYYALGVSTLPGGQTRHRGTTNHPSH
jgi:hypothetical protein